MSRAGSMDEPNRSCNARFSAVSPSMRCDAGHEHGWQIRDTWDQRVGERLQYHCLELP